MPAVTVGLMHKINDSWEELNDDLAPAGGLTGLSAQMFDTISRRMPFGLRMVFANQWLFGGVVEDQMSAVSFGNAMMQPRLFRRPRSTKAASIC